MDPTAPATPSQAQQVAAAVTTAGMTDEERDERMKVEASVRAFFRQFDDDQKFDKPIRTQIKKDRQYASGEAQAQWAVSTNMIGSAIDVLVSTLYARDPDVSVRPAPQVEPPPDPITGAAPPQPERQRNAELAASLELVLSELWKKGKLKVRMRRVIRSILSASHGWLKVLPVSEMQPNPLAQSEYNTLQENVASVAAQIKALQDGQTLEGEGASTEQLQEQQQELTASMEALSSQLEVDTCYGFTFDVVKPENMQVGTDIELFEEYLDSDSLTEIMYFPHDQLRQKFPDLKQEDLLAAEKYYRKAPVNANQGEAQGVGETIATIYPNQGSTDDLYTTTENQEGARPLARVLEKWNKADNHIYTAVCGVKVWARAPYEPSWGSSRFYPYFYFSLNEVDGQRCPQSLSSRGAKLQDEYASVRSNLRITRRRSIPGTLFDAAALADTEAEKLKTAVIAEFTPVKTTLPGQKMSDIFAGKPQPSIDMRLYDTVPITTDLERTFGVQEALQAANDKEITATEATIQQTGTNTRVATWRDTIETVLTDMAQYCAEVSIQKIPPYIAAKIAGPAVLWPSGMSLEDITSLVEVNIAAGTTGKPRNQGDREAWATMLPTLQNLVEKIAQYQQNPATIPLANALSEQVRETARRFGDDSDVERLIPQMPAMPTAALPAAAPGAMPPEAPSAAMGPMQQGIANNGIDLPA